MTKSVQKLAGMALGAVLTMGLCVDVQAAPVSFARSVTELPTVAGPIIQTVTRAGVAHRSSRRTARRVNRRHAY
ncbi:hypothetical protein [Beijerinckia indica]|uniref:Uncharacterized protein n=1 Tax=Beijerinckia indica subsp. indica (strain ATCC 9039 / DSM 1715 / NCIMB 8712) TaxID=395963 RepID=B2IGR5_BEII9|nr:hypothetical protein [Beijerinckia indica]ACB95826.1 hypothetical protein Bind_2207 [Beijerinckia indica subsp. indica ATCC 9039]